MQKSKADYALLETMLQSAADMQPPDIMTSSHSSTSRSPTRRPSFFIPGINGKARCCERLDATKQESMFGNEGSNSSLIGLQVRAASSAGEERSREKKKIKEREHNHKKLKDKSSSSRRSRKSAEDTRRRRRHTDEEKRTRRERRRDEDERRQTRRRRKRFEESRSSQSTRSIDDLDLVDAAEERRRKYLLGSTAVEDQVPSPDPAQSSAPFLDVQDIGYQSEEVMGTLRDRRHDSVGSLGSLGLFRSESTVTKEPDSESLTQSLHDSILQSLGCPRTPLSSRKLGSSLSFNSHDDSAGSATKSPRGHKSMASLLHSDNGEDSQSSLDLDELDEMGPMERLYTTMMVSEWDKSSSLSSSDALMQKLSLSAPTISTEQKVVRRSCSSELPPLPVLGDGSRKKSRKPSNSKGSSTRRSASSRPGEHSDRSPPSLLSPNRRTSSSRSKTRHDRPHHIDEDLSTSNTTKTSSTTTSSTRSNSKGSSSRRACAA